MQSKMVLYVPRLKALCLGWYGKGNCGDESYKDSFKHLFNNLDLEFTDNINNKIYDIVILGGGNIIERPFLMQLKNVEKDIYAFSVGVSEEIKLEDIIKIKKIYIRDIDSYNYLKKIGYENCELCPDAAFCFEPDKNRGRELIEKFFIEKDLYENVITIVVNSHLLGNRDELSRDFLNFQKFVLDMSLIIDETNASFLFLPFSTSEPRDDRASNSWLASKCKYWKKNVVVYDKLDYKDILDIISASNLSINTRLHASIFNCISEVPFIDITHHDKSLGFLKTIDMQHLSIDYWHFEYNKIKDMINNLLNINVESEKIAVIKKTMKDKLKGICDDIYFNKK